MPSIPVSTNKNFLDSGIRITLHGAKKERIIIPFRDSLVYWRSSCAISSRSFEFSALLDKSWKEIKKKKKVSPFILYLHLLLENPYPVFRPQLFPLQYWHMELQLRSVPLHWPLLHLSFRVQRSLSLHATPSLSDQVLTLLLVSHFWKQNIKSNSLVRLSRRRNGLPIILSDLLTLR